MLEPTELRTAATERGHSLLNSVSKTTRERVVEQRKPFLLDDRGRSVPLKARASRKREGITAVSGPLGAGREGILFVPVDDVTAEYLDLETVVVAEVSDRREPRLNHSFSYWPQDRMVVGEVRSSGLYQVFAPPKDPWIRTAFDTLARHWKWVERDPELQALTKRPDSDFRPAMIDRICQLILCAPEYKDVQDPGALAALGPRPETLPALGGFGGGDICAQCLNRFLGEIDVIDGGLIKPPLIKWWWDFFRRCSRWASVGPFPDSTFAGVGRVTQLATHPSDGDVLIAGAAGGGVWRTSNAGTSWHPCMELQPTLTIGAVAIAPSNPSIMYAASGEDGGGWDPAWGGVGVYRSSNAGTTWTLMTRVASTRFSAIVVHPRYPNVIYVAGNRGLHKSVDGGATWRTNPGLDSLFDGQITDVVIGYEPLVILGRKSLDDLSLDGLALDSPAIPGLLHPPPLNAERVYIGVQNDGVYRSLSAGQVSLGTPAFSRLDGPDQLPSGWDAGWIKLAIGRSGANRSSFLAAKLGPDGSRIFTTTDAGTTWTEIAPNVAAVGYDEWCSVIAVDPTDEDVMYAGAAGTLKRTTNGGATAADWTDINNGVHADQQDIVFHPSDSRRLFLANDGGVYRTTDRGTNWTLAAGSLAITQFYDVDISEQDRDVLVGGAQDNGIYYRNVAGVWRNIPWGDGTQVAVDPTDPQIFYFSAQNGLPTWLRRSVDGGASHQPLGQGGLSGGSPWITIIKLEPRDPINNPAVNRVLFVCGYNELFRSTNGGQAWQRVEDGSGAPFVSDGTITALEFSPSDPSVLYLGTSWGAIYRATNGGQTAGDWLRIDTPGSPADALFPFAQVQAITVSPNNPNDVWIVFGGSGVSFTGRPDMILNPLGISHLFRNADAADINGWEDASGQFAALSLPDVPTSAAAVADFDPLVAYAGTDVGVFRTTDGGTTWTAFQDGLPRSPVVELRFNRRWNRLVAGTMGRGAYVRDV
jgi:photosystem II stability/assembly factor-like uncharacterized protein